MYTLFLETNASTDKEGHQIFIQVAIIRKTEQFQTCVSGDITSKFLVGVLGPHTQKLTSPLWLQKLHQ